MTKIYSVEEIVNLTQAVVDDPDKLEKYQEWTGAISSAKNEALNAIVARLTSNRKYTPANIKALREAILAKMNSNNSEKIVETLTHLDKSANELTTASLKLTKASIYLAMAGVILAIIQVLQAFKVL